MLFRSVQLYRLICFGFQIGGIRVVQCSCPLRVLYRARVSSELFKLELALYSSRFATLSFLSVLCPAGPHFKLVCSLRLHFWHRVVVRVPRASLRGVGLDPNSLTA